MMMGPVAVAAFDPTQSVQVMALPFTVIMFVPVVSAEHVPLTAGNMVGVVPPDTIPLLEPPLELPLLEVLPELPDAPLELALPPEPELEVETPLEDELPLLLLALPPEPEPPEALDPPEPEAPELVPDEPPPLLDGSPNVVVGALLPQAERRKRVPSASSRRIARSFVGLG